MKNKLLLILLLVVVSLSAQEIRVIDNTGNGDHESIYDAITYLNGLETIPTDGINFEIVAEQVFTDTLPTITAQATAENPVAFMKSGDGANPVIQLNTDTALDVVALHLLGAAYITFDSITIEDGNPSDDNKYYSGFMIEDSNNITVSNCTVKDFNRYGIDFDGDYVDCHAANNYVYHTADYMISESSITGINVAYGSGAENVLVEKNMIWGLKEASSTVYGIEFNQVTGYAINNMVSLTADNNDKIFGMRGTSREGRTIGIYNNTIRISGTSTDDGFALAVMGGGGDIELKNNIFVNDRTGNEQYVLWLPFQHPGIMMDNNMYYDGTTEGFNGKFSADIYTSLSEWQTATGLASNSVVNDPSFVSETGDDLHLSGDSLGDQIFIAEPLALVTEDIDGETRNAEYPYIGADEDLENPLVSSLADSYTIDNTGNGDFTNFVDAIELLNSGIIPEGGVVFNVEAGQTFTDSLPAITAIATETSPVVFQKTGDGENPQIDYNYSEGYVVEFNGAAYVTFDGIDITDSNDDEIRYEKAYYVFASDHITIQNCNISNYNKYGVHIRDASTNTIVDNNELFYTEEYFTSESTVYNIYVQYNADADNAVITNNKIYGIKEATATIYGIRTFKVSTTIANNFISLTEDNNDKIYGLRLDAGDPDLVMDVFFNTVKLAGTATDDGVCVYRTGTDGLINLKNNILVNERTGEAEHLIYDYTFVSGDWVADYNVMHCENGQIGYWGSTLCEDLASWQTESENDMNSNVTTVEFVGNDDLHLAGASLGNFDFAGIPIDGITTDIDGETRHAVNPYIGADENLENPLNPAEQYVISVDADEINFGTVYTTADIDSIGFNIQNAGMMNLTVSEITSTENFLIRTAETEWVESIEDLILEPAEVVTVYVDFINTVADEFAEELTILSNAVENPEINIDLLATSVQAEFTTDSAEIELPQTANEITSLPREITISNQNEMEFMIDSITVPEGFMIGLDTENMTTELNDLQLEESITVYINMTFADSGIHEGEMEIYSALVHGNGDGTMIALSGETFNFGFTQVTPFMEGVWQSESEMGDYDDDGDLDILITGYALNAANAPIFLYRNDGDGDFTEVNTGMQGAGFGCLDWIDMDNDNDLDVLVSGQHAWETFIGKVYFYEDGEFVDMNTNLPPLKGSISDWKDFDGDGLLDLLYHGEEDLGEDYEDVPYTKVYLNQGNGQFEELDLDILQLSYGDAKFGDYDNDGDLDIAMTGRYGSFDFRTTLYRNDGDNEFFQIDLGVIGLRYSILEWGDYDSDGDLDLFVTGSYDLSEGSLVHILRNDGNDTFVNINADEQVLGVRQGDMKVHDIDNDGDLDVFVNGINSHDLWQGYMYLNQGNDTFSYVDSLVALKYAEYTVGDFDNDYDSDIIMTGRYASEVYISALFENDTELQNTPPTAPTSLTANVDEAEVTLEWEMGNDAETAQLGLTYNLRIGTTAGGNDVVTSMANANGYLKKPNSGNMLNSLGAVVNNLSNGTYYASVQTIDNSFIGSEFTEEVIFEITEGVANEEHEVSALITNLNGNYPNPFNPTTAISFSIRNADDVRIDVYNILGQKVSTIANDYFEKGQHKVVWNGKDESGNSVASGVYFYKMQTTNFTETKKMMLLK